MTGRTRLSMISAHLPTFNAPGLCFSEASAQYKDGKVSREEYLRHCLMHFVKDFPLHVEDQVHISMTYNQHLQDTDPFAHALMIWSNRDSGIEDVAQLECVFQAYYNGTVEEVHARLSPLHITVAKTMRRALAYLALADRKLDVLKYVLNDGQLYFDPSLTFSNGTFNKMALAIDRESEPEVHRVIHGSLWMRRMRRQYALIAESSKRRGDPGQAGARPEDVAAFDGLDFW